MGLTWAQDLGKPECPYLRRWVLNFGRFSIRVHHWHRSDDKRAMHDHPWWFWTLVLKGSYEDWTEGAICAACNGLGKRFTRPVEYHDFVVCQACEGRGFSLEREKMARGKLSFRPALHKHTVNVAPGGCWTLLFMGPQIRHWGFYVRKKSGKWKFKKANKYFLEEGHHPCSQP